MRPATKQKRKLKYKPIPHPFAGKFVQYYANGWHVGKLLHAVQGGSVIIEHPTKGQIVVETATIREL